MSSEALEADVTVAAGAVSVGAAGASPSTPNQSTIDAKITADLDMLMEKMDLCESLMLRPNSDSPAPSVKNDEACQSVIGFLEACAPRMIELVEAAAVGAVTESVLMKALDVNDRLMKQLADIDTLAMTETPASTTAASAAGSSTDAAQDHLDDLLLSNDHGDVFDNPKKPPAATKSTGEDDDDDNDPFGDNVLQEPTSASGASAPASTKSEEDFDSFSMSAPQVKKVN
jgi:hypothetical protein